MNAENEYFSTDIFGLFVHSIPREIKIRTLGALILTVGLLLTAFTGVAAFVGNGIAVIGGAVFILSGKNSMAS